MVANDLRHHRPVPARKFACVTILFSGIVGFKDLCAKYSDPGGAMKIVSLLNDCYTKFDELLDPKIHPNVYKVSKFSINNDFGEFVHYDSEQGVTCRPNLQI